MNKDNEQREISRTLKFRVWNGAEMVYDVTVGRFGVFYVNPTNNGLDPNDSASITPFTTKYHECTPVMQFTGLLDKNGKEIYEGDRLKFFDKEVAIVVWQDFGGWSYQWTDHTYKTIRQQNPEPFFRNISLFEVVGHIFESSTIMVKQ